MNFYMACAAFQGVEVEAETFQVTPKVPGASRRTMNNTLIVHRGLTNKLSLSVVFICATVDVMTSFRNSLLLLSSDDFGCPEILGGEWQDGIPTVTLTVRYTGVDVAPITTTPGWKATVQMEEV
jgi:hypothetical protein